MKRLLLFALLPLAAAPAHAQFRYSFSSQTGQTYTPLAATATSVTGGQAWDEQDYLVTLPFTLNLNGMQSLTKLGVLTSAPGIADDTASGPRNLFSAALADMIDKGFNTASGASLSPLRYAVSGTAPNRVAKIEFRNAAFYDEPLDPDTATVYNDSVSYQYWFYETSNIVELRYGPSHISPNATYFTFGNGPSVGFVQNVDFKNSSIGEVFYLKGSPAAPTLDSTTSITGIGALSSYPASGTVYRFTPKSNGAAVGTVASLTGVSVYPTAAANTVFIANAGNQTLRYSVLTVTGQLVRDAEPLAPGTRQVDVSALPAGAYLIRVDGDGARGTFRFAKM